MQINGIAQQLLAPLGFERHAPSSVETPPAVGIRLASDELVSRTDGGAFHKILSQYDVTNITPLEFSNLLQELHDAGEINDAEFRELARMRLELEQAGVPHDEPLDLIEFFTDKLRKQTEEFAASQLAAEPGVEPDAKAAAAFTAETRRQLEWIRKFALVSAAGAEALDLGA